MVGGLIVMTGHAAGALQPPIVLPPDPAIVTAPVAPVPASARPARLAPAPTVMLAFAITVPLKVVPLSVAEEPTRQKMLHGFAVPTTFERTFAVSELPTLKMKTPAPLSVRVADAGKSGAPVTKE